MRIFIFYFIILLLTFNSKAATCTAVASTNFTLASTWSCGHVPNGFDNIVIPSNFTVTITSAIDLTVGNPSNTSISISGNLFFSGNASRLSLVSSAVVNIASGGKITTDQNNNSNKITIGSGSAEWDSNMGNLTGPLTISNGTLPIELIEFTGTCLSNGVELNWSTASEENNDYFLVEKSSNGTDWELVAKITGSGTSGVVNKYVHIDYTNNNELTYYRLTQVDKNTTKEVFKAIDVNCKNVTNQMILYPNPSSTELNILLDVTTSSNNNYIKILNSVGQIVIETKVDVTKGVNTFVLPVDIMPGTYNIMFSSDNIVLPSQKLMIIK
ncbi:MAG: hypothetical protein C0448_08080 [Sphingobacteriaceae bacterium]|nr:hypothetical protein [Sphingobacteriaceae bacterium]